MWSVEVRAPHLDLRVFAGPRPADVLRRLTERIGRQPPVPAPFVLGPWYQPTGANEAADLQKLRSRDVPLSVAQTYTHYLPCAAQAGREQAERDRVARFHAARPGGHHVLQPDDLHGASAAYAAAAAGGALVKNPARRALRVQLQHARELPGRAVRLHRPGGTGPLRAPAARGGVGWARRLDGGLRRVHPARRTRRRRLERRGAAQRLPAPVPLRRGRRGGAA